MRTKTHTLELDAPKARVFAFVSKVENLPRWATGFCQGVKTVDGKQKIVTPAGEIFFRIESDPRTGTLDMFGGPTEDRQSYWPARVVERPGHGSLFMLTVMQEPGMPDDAFDSQCDALAHEFQELKRQLGVPKAA